MGVLIGRLLAVGEFGATLLFGAVAGGLSLGFGATHQERHPSRTIERVATKKRNQLGLYGEKTGATLQRRRRFVNRTPKLQNHNF